MKKKRKYCIIRVVGLKTGGESMKKIMKISVKVSLILILFVIMFYTFNNSFVYSADTKFNTNEWVPNNGKGDYRLLAIGNDIIGPIQVIGSLVSVVTIIIIGIRYMLGSVEEKAQYKETLGPYFIGAVLVFGTTTVVSVIYNIASSFN